MNRPLPLAALLALLAALLLAPLPTAAQPEQPAGPAELGLSDIPYEPMLDEPIDEEPRIVEEPGPAEAPGEEPELAASLAAESEPNNSRDQADAIGIGLTAGHLGAELSSLSDDDYYRFSATAGRTYVIQTYNIDGTGSRATGLWLYNSSGTQIAEDEYGSDGSGGVNAQIIFTPNNSGTYFILARRASFTNWSGTYSIRVLPRYDQGLTWDTRNDYEPNDTFALANTIELGVSKPLTRQIRDVSNLITPGTDQDVYRFAAVADRTYVIETYNIDGTGSRATGLWLYNSSGTQIAEDEYGSDGSGVVNARIVFKATSSATYFILVSRASFTTWSGTYSIRILPRYGEPGAAWTASGEPNDVFALANSLSTNPLGAQNRQIEANDNYVSPRTDQDLYRFTAVAGRTYILQTYNVQRGERQRATGLWLYNSSGTLIDDDEYGSNGRGNANAQIIFRPVNSDTYFILVSRASFTTWSGSYSVRACQNSCTFDVYLPALRQR